MADAFTIPADRLHPVPNELDDRQAVLIEPLSTPVHAVPGGAARGQGCRRPWRRHHRSHGVGGRFGPRCIEGRRDGPPGEQRRRALDLGAHAVVDATRAAAVEEVRGALGESADVVFDCVAVQRTVGQAIAMALKAGTVVVVGVPAADVEIPLPLVQDRQVRIQGSATYLPEDYAEAIDLLSRGVVRPEDFITGAYALDDVAEAFTARPRLST